MVNRGDTIVYKLSDGTMMFYWLVDTINGYMVFFNWYSNPEDPAPTDFWRMTPRWFEDKVKEGKIEVFNSFPEKYNDIFIQQANIQAF